MLKRDGKSLQIVKLLELLNQVTIAHSGVPLFTKQFTEQFTGHACNSMLDLYIGYDEQALSPSSHNLTTFSYTIFTFPLFFDLISYSFILISFRLYDPSAFYYVFLIPLPTTSITPSSILHPLSIFHPPSLHHSVTLITSFCLYVSQLLASPFHSIIIFLTSVHYSLPPHSNFVYLTFCPLWLCESFSTFSILPHSPSYSEPCNL